MTAEEIEAIVGGYHGDAFRILGPHVVRKKAGQTRWEVRAFLPQAESVEVQLGGERIAMPRIHPQGFFCVSVNGDIQPYVLRARLYDGREVEIEDPYRFGPQISDSDLYLHTEGTLHEAWRTLGAHLVEVEGVRGVRFAVWAPNAENVTVTGEFNDWDVRRHPMRRRNGGVWELFIPGLRQGTSYKYNVRSRFAGYQQLKADPYAFYCETPPKSASVVWDTNRYTWSDAAWMEGRSKADCLKSPMSVYEVHLESWLRGPQGQPLSYRELAVKLVEYVKQMGYTHIELLPIMEHPFSGSWGYQVIGYYAPTSRFGTPDDFKYFIDRLPPGGHRRDCGLGAGALPEGRPRPGLLRRHRALRACRPAQGRASRLGHAGLQLRPQRGQDVPDLQRPVLAEGVSHRRPARGRRGLHAVPGLFAQGGRVDSQPVRRQRKSGSHRFPAPLQRTGAHRARRLHGRRGIHRVSRRLASRST